MAYVIRKAWRYKGIVVFPAAENASGIRWYARNVPNSPRTLLADSKESMRHLITKYLNISLGASK